MVSSLLALPLAAACGARRQDRAGEPGSEPPAPGAEREAVFDVIEVPSNLGLRPPRPGVEPGTWRAPEVLMRAGLGDRLGAARRAVVRRRPYRVDAVPGTRIRNGAALREISLELAGEVERSLARGAVPVVVGGDCGVLLGCVVGLRRAGGRGLIHVDGHSDFYHPRNYDPASALGSVAGMDLALATGRGEPILTAWPGVAGPLVADADAVQIGERDAAQSYRDIEATAIARISVQAVQAQGVAAAVARATARLAERELTRAWLHIDLDVLDQSVMPAVDSPGTPGLAYRELIELVRGLAATRRIAGIDVAIYDPDLDPSGAHAAAIVEALAAALRGWPSRE
jgi:arginase